MLPYYEIIFVWNCIPFHPHETGNILKKKEYFPVLVLRKFYPFLEKIHHILNPKRVISIGKISHNAFNYLKIPSNYVIHPSYGKSQKFKKGMLDFFQNYNLNKYDTIKYFKPTVKSIQNQDKMVIDYKGNDPVIEIARRKARILLIDQTKYTHIATSWIGTSNRAALIATLMASKHAGINVKNDYFEHVSKLTGKSCKRMPNFLSKLRKTPLVDKDLNWQDETFSGAEQLARLLF
jgi:hypothetical protein